MPLAYQVIIVVVILFGINIGYEVYEDMSNKFSVRRANQKPAWSTFKRIPAICWPHKILWKTFGLRAERQQLTAVNQRHAFRQLLHRRNPRKRSSSNSGHRAHTELSGYKPYEETLTKTDLLKNMSHKQSFELRQNSMQQIDHIFDDVEYFAKSYLSFLRVIAVLMIEIVKSREDHHQKGDFKKETCPRLVWMMKTASTRMSRCATNCRVLNYIGTKLKNSGGMYKAAIAIWVSPCQQGRHSDFPYRIGDCSEW